jgi:hypothetical protein
MLNYLRSYLPFFAAAVIATGQVITMSTGTAHAATLDELKGLSVQVGYTSYISVRSPSDAKYNRVQLRSDLRIYIGLKGTIFEYSHTNTSGGSVIQNTPVFTINRARHRSHDLLMVWTIDRGTLMKIVQLVSGFEVVSLMIDPEKLTCKFDSHDEPDTTTGRILLYSSITGELLETGNKTVASYTCAVSRGNIFAADQ